MTETAIEYIITFFTISLYMATFGAVIEAFFGKTWERRFQGMLYLLLILCYPQIHEVVFTFISGPLGAMISLGMAGYIALLIYLVPIEKKVHSS